MERAMENWFRGFSLASIEMHFEIMKEILYSGMIKVEQLNNYAAALLGQKEGVVIACRMPQARGVEELSVERIQNAFVHSLSKSEYISSVDKQVSWPKFNVADRQALLVSEAEDPVTGATVFSLDNGVKAIFKKMDTASDTVAFGAVSKGGMSVCRTKFGRDINLYVSDIANLSAVGGYSRSDWEKLFSYNNMQVNVSIDDYKEEMRGYCTGASLEKLFHFINLSFTQRKDDYNAFEVYRKGKAFEAQYRRLSPEKVFEDSVAHYNSGNRRFLPTRSPEYLKTLDYHKVHAAIRERLGNPADFVFVFAGNAQLEEVREHVVKYLGSLKTSHDTEEWFVIPDYPAKGRVERRFLHQMVLPRSFVDVTVSCGMQNTQKNRALGGIMEEYIREICSNGIIRELSPESSVLSGIEVYPEEIFVCSQRFETDSAGVQQLLDVLDGRLMDVAYNGISEEGFVALKKKFAGKVAARIQNSSFWVDSYLQGHLQGKDLYSGYLTVIETITPQDFKEFVDKVCRRGNRITVVMEGTTEDVNTQNLFRENQFIREFFDL
jgi:zinc protease